MFVLWILAGIAVIALACFLIPKVMDIYNEGLALFCIFMTVILLGIGFTLPFVPLILADGDNEHRLMEACEDIGGEYRVIKEEYDGSQYVDVYGCVQGD